MPATDTFTSQQSGLNSPAANAVAITPDDANDMANACRGLYVGAGGNLKVTTTGGNTVTFVGLSAGTIIPVRATRVWANGTTASSIVALY